MLVHDASTRPGHGDEFVSKLLQDVTVPVVLVLNKIDLVAKSRLLPVIEQLRQWREFADIVPVSAATGDGVDALERLLLEQMPEGPSRSIPDDYLTDQPRARAGRRRPSARRCCTTRATSCRSRPRWSSTSSTSPSARRAAAGLLHDLRRDRVAEADRHRPRRLDDQADRHRGAPGARGDFFECKVFLDLRVKVKSDWRDDERVLDDLGLRRKR